MYAFELFVSDEFDIRENSDVDEIEFIRRFKLMGMGVKSKMPTKLTAERVVVVPIQTAAKELGVTRGRLRIKSHLFETFIAKIQVHAEFLVSLEKSPR